VLRPAVRRPRHEPSGGSRLPAASRAWPGALALAAVVLAGALVSVTRTTSPRNDAIAGTASTTTTPRCSWKADFRGGTYGRGGEPFFPYLQLLGFCNRGPAVHLLQKLAGLPSITAYALHYFFQIYLFVLGTYLVAPAPARMPPPLFCSRSVALTGLCRRCSTRTPDERLRLYPTHALLPERS